MIKLTESNFRQAIAEHKKVIVMFYREKGCSFCDKMKPVFEELEESGFVKAQYELGAAPDSITQGLIERFPTFVAYENGEFVAKQEGVLSAEQVVNTLSPDKLPKKAIPLEKATMLQLMADEAALIDQIYPLKDHLTKIRAEIERRRNV